MGTHTSSRRRWHQGKGDGKTHLQEVKGEPDLRTPTPGFLGEWTPLTEAQRALPPGPAGTTPGTDRAGLQRIWPGPACPPGVVFLAQFPLETGSPSLCRGDGLQAALTEVHPVPVIALQQGQQQLPQRGRGLPGDAGGPEDREVSLKVCRGMLAGGLPAGDGDAARGGDSHGHQGLVLLVEEAEVLRAACLVGKQWCEGPSGTGQGCAPLHTSRHWSALPSSG